MKRPEVAGAIVVVFQKIAVDLELLEQRFGDGLVAAFRCPGTAEVAAAQVHAHGHLIRLVGDARVDPACVHSR